MKEVLDQNSIGNVSSKTPNSNQTFNLLSLLLICFSGGMVLYTAVTVGNDLAHPVSPFLPRYTAYYVHSELINFTVIQSIGIIPALLLRWRRKYAFAFYLMIACVLAAKLLQNQVEFYWNVYHLVH